MKKNKNIVFNLGILFLSFMFFACNMFENSVPEFLEKYTTEIMVGDFEFNNYQRDKDGNICIPSSSDYCVTLYLANPGKHGFYLQYPKGSDEWGQLPSDSLRDDFYIENMPDSRDYITLTFNSSYLQSKDSESADRNYNQVLRIKDVDNGREFEPFNLSFTVNNPPDIFTAGMEVASNKLILCLSIKNFTSNNVYNDFTTDADGYYSIYINNEKHKFKIESGSVKFYKNDGSVDSNFSTTKFSYQTSIPGFSFTPASGSFNVYYHTDKDYRSNNPDSAQDYTVKTIDSHNLVYSQLVSVHTEGKTVCPKPSIQKMNQEDDYYICPSMPIGEDSDITICYKIDDGDVKFCAGQSFVIGLRLCGGVTKVEAWQQMEGYLESEHVIQNIEYPTTIYVGKIDDDWEKDDSYIGGASKEYPISSIKKALEIIKKKEQSNPGKEWTIYLLNNIAENIEVVGLNTVKSLTIRGDGNSKIKITPPVGKSCININNMGTSLVALENLEITGSTDSGVKCQSSSKLNITNCDIHGNTADSGAGLYYSGASSTVTIKNSKIYSNTATNNGGGIYFSGNTLSFDGTTIGDTSITGTSSTTCSNKAKSGGGIYVPSGTNTPNISFSNSSMVCGNYASSTGGGISNAHNNCTISNPVIKNNAASSYCGITCYNLNIKGTIEMGTNDDINVNTNNNGKITFENCTVKSDSIKLGVTSLKSDPYCVVSGVKDADKGKFVTRDSTKYAYFDNGSIMLITKDGHVIDDSVIATNDKSILQTIIDKAKDQNNGDYVIVFTKNITENGDALYEYSPAIFDNSNITYKIIGNGYFYNANRKQKNASAFRLNGANVQVYDLKITGGVNSTGGGAYICNGGKLELYKGAQISENFANRGAGVFIDYGYLYLNSGSKITENEATTGEGGGVLIDKNGVCNLENGSEISLNISSGNGAAVYCKGTLRIGGATINGNTSKGKNTCPGVYLCSDSKVDNMRSSNTSYLKMSGNKNLNNNNDCKFGIDIHCENSFSVDSVNNSFRYMELQSDTENLTVNLYIDTTIKNYNNSQGTTNLINNKIWWYIFDNGSNTYITQTNIKRVGWNGNQDYYVTPVNGSTKRTNQDIIGTVWD